MTTYNRIKRIISDYKNLWKCHTHFEWFLENPFYIINNKTIRRIFALPKVQFSVFQTYKCPWWSNAVFGVYFVGLQYKSKYDNCVYEADPFVQFNLFGVSFRWQFKCPSDDVSKYGYWESILDCYCNYVYSNKRFNLYNIIEENTWKKWNDKWKEEKEDMLKILTPYGINRYWSDLAIMKQEESE